MRRIRPPRAAPTFVLLGGILLIGGCSEPSSLSCPPGNGDLLVADNPLGGRWADDGESPRLSEEWRTSVPEGAGSVAAGGVRVGTDGVLTFANLRAGTIIELDPVGDSGPIETPLPTAVEAAIGAAVLDERLPPPVLTPLAAGGFLVALPPRPTPGGADQERLALVVRMAVDGSLTDTVSAVSVNVLNDHGYVEWPRPGTRIPLIAVGPADAVALAGATSAYRIDVLRPDFTDSLVICRQAAALPLTETEAGEVELAESPPQLAWLLRGSKKVQPPLPFGRMFIGSEGRLWVQRERPDPQRTYAQPEGAAYDVFAAGGEYLGEVRAPDDVVLIADTGGFVYGLEASGGLSGSLVAYRLR